MITCKIFIARDAAIVHLNTGAVVVVVVSLVQSGCGCSNEGVLLG